MRVNEWAAAALHSAETKTAQAKAEAPADTPAQASADAPRTDLVALTEQINEQVEARKKAYLYTAESPANKFKISYNKPQDKSAALTARLVAARAVMEVSMVSAEASSNLMQLKMVAAFGEGDDKKKAIAAVRKLEQLLGRCRTKIRDLEKEDSLEGAKAAAKRRKQELREREIKEELRSLRRRRKAREERWLREAAMDFGQHDDRDKNLLDRLDPAAEAQLALEAEAIAAAEVAAGGDPGGDAGGMPAADGAGGEPSGGETAGGAAAGGIDISV